MFRPSTIKFFKLFRIELKKKQSMVHQEIPAQCRGWRINTHYFKTISPVSLLYGDDSEDGDLFVFEKEDELISDEAIDFLASTLRHGERINQLFFWKKQHPL